MAYLQRDNVKEKARLRARIWNANNKDKKAAASKAWYESNKDRANALCAAWIAANKSRHRDYQRLYQAGRRVKVGFVSVGKIDLAALLKRAGGCCEICGTGLGDTGFHVDHIIPIARGGLHTQENLQIAHPFCNQSKGVN